MARGRHAVAHPHGGNPPARQPGRGQGQRARGGAGPHLYPCGVRASCGQPRISGIQYHAGARRHRRGLRRGPAVALRSRFPGAANHRDLPARTHPIEASYPWPADRHGGRARKRGAMGRRIRARQDPAALGPHRPARCQQFLLGARCAGLAGRPVRRDAYPADRAGGHRRFPAWRSRLPDHHRPDAEPAQPAALGAARAACAVRLPQQGTVRRAAQHLRAGRHAGRDPDPARQRPPGIDARPGLSHAHPRRRRPT
ncbi:hypothetical protein D9M68_370540 [compost metagenome]